MSNEKLIVLKGDELKKALPIGWSVLNELRLEKEYSFSDFKKALVFVNKVGHLAERQNHHPEILLSYGKVRIALWTHSVGGVSAKDVYLAAEINRV